MGYETLHGYRSYLFQPKEGNVTLHEMLEKGSAKPRKVVELMLAGGEAVQKLHESGFLHNDVTLQNLVYDPNKKIVRIRDLEALLPISEAEKGVKEFRGTPGYIHPEWYKASRREFIRGGVINYSTKNDTYGFLHSADLALRKAKCEEEPPVYQTRLRDMQDRITYWKEHPYEELPELENVLDFLRAVRI